MMEDKKFKIVYIAGIGRSGSTILDNVLGQLDGFVSVGELQHIWRHGVIQNRLCGCGLPHRECNFWSEIIQDGFGTMNTYQAQKWDSVVWKVTRVWRIFWHIFIRDRKADPVLDGYLNALDALYNAVAKSSKSRVIVDSSKYPMFIDLLNLIPSLDVYTIHLVRDPRAVAYSWMTPKAHRDPNAPPFMDSKSPWMSTLVWNIWNPITQYLGRKTQKRCMFLRYEDFSKDPETTIKNIMKFVGEEKIPLPMNGDKTFQANAVHSIDGNPIRFQSGLISINEDERWHSRMQKKDKIVVTLMALPLLIWYGYPLAWS